MKQDIKPDYSQTFLFPPALEDWVTEDHPARFVRDFVESLDLPSLGFSGDPPPDGRPRYSEELLLKIWILGYFNDIRSSRKLERACNEMVGFIWLAGRLLPDHNTLWRFFQKHGKAIQQIFVQTTLLARSLGLLGMAKHAIDGTKIRGRGSDNAVRRKKKLEKALAIDEERIKQYLRDVAQAQQEEDGQYKLPEEVKDAEKRKAWIQEQLAQMKSQGVKATQSSDPDARQMKCDDGHHFGYNAQAVVDLDSGVVVAADITTEQSDTHQLLPMTRQVRENLGETAEETLADGGYVTLEHLGEAQQEGINVTIDLSSQYLARPGDSPFHPSHFTYDKDKDVVVCPLGKELKFGWQMKARRGEYRNRIYRCCHAKDCPARSQCCPKKTPRRIAISPFHEALEEQRDKTRDAQDRHEMRMLRRQVETLFGNVKGNRCFRRFTGWGTKNAKAQWSMLCLTNNLRKIYKFSATPVPSC